jgi:hypothetical protein
VPVAGLSADEVAGFREQVAAGRKPRVVFTEAAGQVAGQVGQVVGLLDPAESDEFVVVRFGKDELPFSPGDLRVAPRGAAGRKVAAPPAAPAPVPAPALTPSPEFVLDKPAPARPSPARPPAARPSPAPPPAAAPAAAPVPAPRKGGPARAAKPKAPAGLTVTLAYADGEWTVAATQGAKSLARPYVVRPAEALRMVGLVDVPGVREAVEQILAVERAEAQSRAEKLRAELAEVEARLAELPETP